MKKIILLCAVAVLAGIIANPAEPPSGKVTLAWDYEVLDTNNTFRIYHTTNITTPKSNWVVIATVPGTNLTATVYVTPGVNFFAATVSNMWMESDFSNVASTPALPVARDVNITVRRAD